MSTPDYWQQFTKAAEQLGADPAELIARLQEPGEKRASVYPEVTPESAYLHGFLFKCAAAHVDPDTLVTDPLELLKAAGFEKVGQAAWGTGLGGTMGAAAAGIPPMNAGAGQAMANTGVGKAMTSSFGDMGRGVKAIGSGIGNVVGAAGRQVMNGGWLGRQWAGLKGGLKGAWQGATGGGGGGWSGGRQQAMQQHRTDAAANQLDINAQRQRGQNQMAGGARGLAQPLLTAGAGIAGAAKGGWQGATGGGGAGFAQGLTDMNASRAKTQTMMAGNNDPTAPQVANRGPGIKRMSMPGGGLGTAMGAPGHPGGTQLAGRTQALKPGESHTVPQTNGPRPPGQYIGGEPVGPGGPSPYQQQVTNVKQQMQGTAPLGPVTPTAF